MDLPFGFWFLASQNNNAEICTVQKADLRLNISNGSFVRVVVVPTTGQYGPNWDISTGYDTNRNTSVFINKRHCRFRGDRDTNGVNRSPMSLQFYPSGSSSGQWPQAIMALSTFQSVMVSRLALRSGGMTNAIVPSGRKDFSATRMSRSMR